MTVLIPAVVLAQLADLASWLPAITNVPGGEGNPFAAAATVEHMVIAKLLGTVVLVIGLAALRRYRRPLAVLFVVVGLVGAATNVVNGGLLG